MFNMRLWITLGCVAVGGVAAAAPPLFHEEAVARNYLAGRPELGRGDDLVVERQAEGRVRFRRHHGGVPIIGGVVTVSLDGAGLVRAVDADGGEVPPGLGLDPVVSIDEARLLAATHGNPEGARAQLVVDALPGHEARLAWRVDLSYSPGRGAYRVFVDALDGRTLRAYDRVRTTKRGKVFKSSHPVVGSLEEVTLDLPDGSARMVGPRFDVKSCVDKFNCPVQGTRDCEFQSLAVADGAGDFLYERPATDDSPSDGLAEVNVFYHLMRAQTAFTALGAPSLNQVPIPVYVNFREGTNDCVDPGKPLSNYENAAFAPGFRDGKDAFLFGQGEEIDYSYDWPVAYHEFTHGVQGAYYDVASIDLDTIGLNDDGGAIAEGTADYFAAVITGQTKLGEYALPAELVRDITVLQKCPDDYTGEVHDDGELWASGLWAARTALPEAQRPLLDKAVLASFDRVGDTLRMAFFRNAILEEVTRLAGAAAATTVDQKLTANGLPCSRVYDYTFGSTWGALFILTSADDTFVPTAVQWKIKLKRKVDRLVIRSRNRIGAVLAGVMRLGMKAGTSPIAWSANTGRSDAVQHVTTKRDDNTLLVEGPFTAGDYVVQISLGQLSDSPDSNVPLYMENIVLTAEPDPNIAEDDGGCAVGRGGRGAGGAATLLMVLAALGLTSRRPSRSGRGSRSSR